MIAPPKKFEMISWAARAKAKPAMPAPARKGVILISRFIRISRIPINHIRYFAASSRNSMRRSSQSPSVLAARVCP